MPSFISYSLIPPSPTSSKTIFYSSRSHLSVCVNLDRHWTDGINYHIQLNYSFGMAKTYHFCSHTECERYSNWFCLVNSKCYYSKNFDKPKQYCYYVQFYFKLKIGQKMNMKKIQTVLCISQHRLCKAFCVPFTSEVGSRGRAWCHTRVDSVPVQQFGIHSLARLEIVSHCLQHKLLTTHWTIFCSYQQQRNMSTDRSWTVHCVRVIQWDTNKVDVLINSKFYSFHKCWFAQQPSWILSLPFVRCVWLSKSEIWPQGAL